MVFFHDFSLLLLIKNLLEILELRVDYLLPLKVFVLQSFLLFKLPFMLEIKLWLGILERVDLARVPILIVDLVGSLLQTLMKFFHFVSLFFHQY